jgi:hypothetical protein
VHGSCWEKGEAMYENIEVCMDGAVAKRDGKQRKERRLCTESLI